MEKLSIIKAQKNHAKEIYNLLIRTITEICGRDYNNDPNIMEDWLSNKTPENISTWINNSNYTFVALSQNNMVIGIVLMNSTGEILLNYVLPEYLQKGVGKALLHKIEAVARENSLTTLSARSTITAKTFYEKNGFTPIQDKTTDEVLLNEYPLEKRLL
jgi:N-acetylglutamate synthase-like GNAT family acetyltransferase